MTDHQLYLGERPVDRDGSHPGELVVEGFSLGDHVLQDGYPEPFEVIGYYRGSVVLRTPANGCSHHATPTSLRVIA